MPPLLEMRGIVRCFGALRANDEIDLEVRAGQIVGLLGENGSGKSTLMKVLFGMLSPDSGKILFRGQELSGHRPRDAIAVGIAMIHQHFMLVDAMTVVENIMLGWPAAGRVLRTVEMADRVREASRRFGLDLDPFARVGNLSLGRKQRVEILKAILREAELLILDEPTSNLAPTEVGDLLKILRDLRADGKGIIFISHKLPEVLEICDAIVVLRDGRVANRTAAEGASQARLAAMMVQRETGTLHVRTQRTAGEERLAVHDLSLPGLSSLSFKVRGGEIVGVAGIDGNGQIELAEALAGIRRAETGTITLDGTNVTHAPVATRVQAGMAYMPADRSYTALVRTMSVAENLMLRDSNRPPYARGILLARRALAAKARELMKEYDIRASGPGACVARLSGGNQQKIVIARELERDPAVLVAHQATWGLDPGATHFVLDRVMALRDAGAAVLYISSELEEVLSISDWIAVMADGCFAGFVSRADADRAQIGLWMSGRSG